VTPWWSRLPVGVIVLLLFGLGAYRAATAPDAIDGASMMTTALILVGVWIAVELHDKWHGKD
jgi:Na+/pantothenate symporter